MFKSQQPGQLVQQEVRKVIYFYCKKVGVQVQFYRVLCTALVPFLRKLMQALEAV